MKEKRMEMIEYRLDEPSQSLKHQLVAAVAKGDEIAAEELRLLLKLTAPEKFGNNHTK